MSQQEKKLIAEIKELLIQSLEKQTNMECELSEIKNQIAEILNFINFHGDSESAEETTLIEYVNRHYGHLNTMGKAYLNEEAYRTRNYKLKMWRNLLNKRKIAFFNAIKSQGTSEIYKEFLQQCPVFIPRKFRERITAQDTEQQKEIKRNLNVLKVEAQIKILEDKITHYTTMYSEIDAEMGQEIINLCPQEMHLTLKEIWDNDTKKQEEISKQIWIKKEKWIKNLPTKESEEEKEQQRRNLRRMNQQNRTANFKRRTEHQLMTNMEVLHNMERNVKFHNNRVRNNFTRRTKLHQERRTPHSQMSYADVTSGFNAQGSTQNTNRTMNKNIDNNYNSDPSTVYIGKRFKNHKNGSSRKPNQYFLGGGSYANNPR